MSFADPAHLSGDLGANDKQNLALRLWTWVVYRWRPFFGWSILFCTLLLAWLPMQAATANEWIALGSYSNRVAPLGPLGVLLIWIIMGWHQQRTWDHLPRGGFKRRIRLWGLLLLILGVGLLLLSQALVAWIPGPSRLFQTLLAGGWGELAAQCGAELATIGNRLARWWSGVLAGGATQDDLVFAAFAGLIAWLNGLFTGYLVRRGHSGLLCGLPSLWLLIITLLYGSAGRMVFIVGLVITVLLHVLLDQRRLSDAWERSGTSYGEGLILDRLLAVAGTSVLIFGLAAVMPNLRLTGLADRYLQLYSPFNDQVEGFGQRLFPDLKATSRFRGSALADGLPNSFLLGAGPELSEIEVMRFRTDEPMGFEPEILEEIPAPGHYMRGGTLSRYDGLGWQNPVAIDRNPIGADQFVPNLLLSEQLEISEGVPEIPRGRRLLTQDIFLRFNSRALYGASEPLSFSVDYRMDQRGPGDSTSFWADRSRAGGGNQSASSYTVISAIPNANEAALVVEEAILPDADDPLWNELIRHLALPETITERTRQLAEELTAGVDGTYAKATAIEQYLRGFEYDLSVSKPPDEVTDVADYFLFDLQRGYCDYYATSFIVLARLAGLPARFATGFATGRWNSAEGMWIVTEAEAHSWPEVYFPSYGWIAFEPTAGRAALTRVGIGPETFSPILPAVTTAQEPTVVDETTPSWNWQMLVWLLPFGLLLWGAFRLFTLWQHRRQDPWTFILRWGQKIGRPIQAGETVLEYGTELGNFVLERHRYGNQDTGRAVAREIASLSAQLTALQYGPSEQRTTASELIEKQWGVLRAYVAQLS